MEDVIDVFAGGIHGISVENVCLAKVDATPDLIQVGKITSA